jgi:hypothetical protein
MTIPGYTPRFGLNPQNADEVNSNVGMILRQFTDIKESIAHYAEWLGAVDLKAAPYHIPEEQESVIKSAVVGLDTSLDAVDMTFIRQLTGVW